MRKTQRSALWQWLLCLALLAAYTAAVGWLHWQQYHAHDWLYNSDLLNHLSFSRLGISSYSLVGLVLYPLYTVGGYPVLVALLGVLHAAAIVLFAAGLRRWAPAVPWPMALAAATLGSVAQAVWMPRGGYWFRGTITGSIFHNTTYIALAPVVLGFLPVFCPLWQQRRTRVAPWRWLACTALLTLSTAIKTNFVIAFAPALLCMLIVDLWQTRGKNLWREVTLGCMVLPSIAVAMVQSAVMFTEENDSHLLPFFLVEFDRLEMPWGPFNRAGVLGILRSLVFVAAVALLLRGAWKHTGYRVAWASFAVAVAEAVLLMEDGYRMYHANLWWGPFICFLLVWVESTGAWLQQAVQWRHGTRDRRTAVRLAVCGAAWVWHVVSGICFLVLLMQGKDFNIPIETYRLW